MALTTSSSLRSVHAGPHSATVAGQNVPAGGGIGPVAGVDGTEGFERTGELMASDGQICTHLEQSVTRALQSAFRHLDIALRVGAGNAGRATDEVIFMPGPDHRNDEGGCRLPVLRRLGASLVGIAALALTVSSCSSSSGHSADSSNGTSPNNMTSSTATPQPAPSLAPVHGRYAPTIDPANFVRTVDNRYWPLLPGTHYHYEGVRGRAPQTDDEVVLPQVKRVAGVLCTVVRDTVSEHGRPVERTFDWYAQDKQGNVWYMGEDSLELANGRFVRASDSWETGVDGAKSGIIMAVKT